LLAAVPSDELSLRGDIQLALDTVSELLTGDLTNVPATVVGDMNRWLEDNKYLAKRTVTPADER